MFTLLFLAKRAAVKKVGLDIVLFFDMQLVTDVSGQLTFDSNLCAFLL